MIYALKFILHSMVTATLIIGLALMLIFGVVNLAHTNWLAAAFNGVSAVALVFCIGFSAGYEIKGG